MRAIWILAIGLTILCPDIAITYALSGFWSVWEISALYGMITLAGLIFAWTCRADFKRHIAVIRRLTNEVKQPDGAATVIEKPTPAFHVAGLVLNDMPFAMFGIFFILIPGPLTGMFGMVLLAYWKGRVSRDDILHAIVETDWDGIVDGGARTRSSVETDIVRPEITFPPGA